MWLISASHCGPANRFHILSSDARGADITALNTSDFSEAHGAVPLTLESSRVANVQSPGPSMLRPGIFFNAGEAKGGE